MDEALALIKKYEGCHRLGPDGLYYPYLCPAGVPTIGWGTVIPTMNHPPITLETANEWLDRDFRSFWIRVRRACPILVTLPDECSGACTSFAYNLGIAAFAGSTLRRKIMEGEWGDVMHEFPRWCHAAGMKLPGLVRRRNEEALMFIDGIYKAATPETETSP